MDQNSGQRVNRFGVWIEAQFRVVIGLGIISLSIAGQGRSWAHEDTPFLRAEQIFPLEHWHNHGSCIVECPNGDLLVCWYHGSGERKADDVVILGARKRKTAQNWSAPFLMADTPGYPDTNPAMFIDPHKRLWLIWPVILANRWESALLKYAVSDDYRRAGAPRWVKSDVLHVTPAADFESSVNAALDRLAARPDLQRQAGLEEWIGEKRTMAADKLSSRLGWMTRVHPFVLDRKRLIVPLYSDGFDFSLMAVTDDWGSTWLASEPLVGPGNVQPSLVRKRDGTLVAFMRDNGPPPMRVQVSQSKDGGISWSPVCDSSRVDTGAGVESLALRNGNWILINNDLEKGRHRLAVALSEDEGATWRWTRYIERDSEADIEAGAGSYHYPSVIQARDGTIHVSYSFRQKQRLVQAGPDGKPATESIKHAHFNESWIRATN